MSVTTSSLHGFRSAAVFAGMMALLATNGCSCARDHEAPPPRTGESHETTWSIQIDIGDGAERKRVALPPVAEVSAGAPTSHGEAPAPSTKATIETPDGSVTTSPDLDEPAPTGTNAWALVYGAAAECGMTAAGIGSVGLPLSPVALQTPAVPPWRPLSGGGSAFYIFEHLPTACDETFAYEEALICIADKLMEISDSLTPIRWANVAKLTPYETLPAGPWTIPPQAEKDRFIARDLAMNVLAHVPRVDSVMLNAGGTSGSCSRLLAKAASSSSFATANAATVYGTSSYPPPALPVTANYALSQARLTFEAHLLRTSSQMLHDLIRRSVFADLAGAERRAAHALDPLKGSRIAWGLEDNQNGPYNSYAHAIRVLAGRWEVGPYSPDPKCGGVANLDLLASAYGNDRESRDGDVPIASAGQEYAARLMDKAGLVFPEFKLEANDSISSIRAALRAQLLSEVAISRGLLPTDHAGLGDQKELIDLMVDRAKDGDLQAAAERSIRRFRLLTNTDVTTAVTSGIAGLTAKSYAAPAVSSAAGIAVDRGVSLARLAGDAMARVGGLLEATQCDEHFGTTSQAGTDNWDGAYPTGSSPADRAQRWAMQDVFNVGHALLRRMVVLREESSAVGGLAEDGPVDRLARSGMAEVRSWAGAARVFSYVPLDSSMQIAGPLTLAIVGAHPEDFAVTAHDKVAAQLSVVFGPPWVAECAARLRDGCPADFATKYVRRASGFTVLNPPFNEPATGDPAYRRTWGFTGAVVQVSFSLDTGTATSFAPAMIGAETKNDHLYLVADRDPKDPMGRGMVLGTIALRTPTGFDQAEVATGFAISPMQRELFNAVLGISTGSGLAELGEPTAGKSPSYCIDGVPRDLFVPLENELTSDSDQYENSWRHYLTLAESAATKADELAQKMIDVGLQKDFRREAAQEGLAEICGEPAALQKLTFTPDGKPSAAKGEENIAQCLGEAKWDVVFLGQDPIPAETGRREALRQALGCDPPSMNSSDLCKRLGVGADAKLVTTMGLNIAVTPKLEPSSACKNMAAAAQSLRSGLNDYTAKEALLEPWAEHDRLAGIARNLSMKIEPTGDWSVYYSGEVIMQSTAPAPSLTDKIWPGCMWGPTGAGTDPAKTACDFANNPLPKTLNAVFRRCADVLNRENQPLGGCETPVGSDAKQAELQALRWRVMSALWTLGAATGNIPNGMFNIQIPAVAFNASAWGTDTKSVDEVLTYYPPGDFLLSGRLNAAAAEDANLLGATTSIPTSKFTDFATSSSSEIPPWIRSIYSSAARYRHVSAVNEDVPSDFYHLNAFFAGKLGRKPSTIDYIEQTTLVDILSGMSGLGCSDLFGSSGAGAWSDAEIVSVVSSIKTNAIVRQSASNPVVDFPAVYYGWNLLRLEPTPIGESGCFAESIINDGVFHNGYFDRKQPGLLFRDDLTVSSPFVLRGSGTLSSTPVPGYCSTSTVSHPTVTPGASFPKTSELKPERRVRAFAGSSPPPDACGAAHQLVQALTLGCLAGDNRSASPSKAIEVTQPGHIPALHRWIAASAKDARTRLGKMYLEGVPKRLVAEVKQDGLGSSSKKGAKGDKLIEAAAAFGNVTNAWLDVTDQLEQMGLSVEKASLEVNAASLAGKEDLINLAVRRMNAVARMVRGALEALPTVVDGVTKWGKNTPMGLAEVAAGLYEMNATFELENIAEKQKDNKVAQALVGLRSDILSRTTQLQKSITAIKASAGQIAAASSAIERLENKARLEAAKGAGQDFYQTSSGEIVNLPVNTALRRQYDILGIRYRNALADAKYLAFLARRAIEQRIGVPLEKISTTVGAVEAPSSWADDVCDLEGIDYKKLTDKVGPDAGSDTEYVKDLSKQYIGDYVAKLKSFVEYYNVEFPSHEGDDTAIFSLKDDLLAPPDICLTEATNLLHYSGRLDMVAAATESPPKGDGRWRMHECAPTATKCIKVEAGAALDSPTDPPATALRGSISWLRDVASSVGGDAGTDAGSDSGTDAGSDGGSSATVTTAPGLLKGPSGMVSQAVHLAPGTYVLSWWDQARTADGKTTVSSAVPYRVAVYSNTFALVAAATPTPQIATSGVPWSERRSLTVNVTTAGDYYVSFGASAPGDSSLGSVAIANVQLENAPAGGEPTAYVATLATRSVVSGSCPHRSSGDLRAAFERRCTSGGVCWYELMTPFLIDTGLVKTPTAAAHSKLAKGNFNYRHITVALNLVGTGVRSCESTPTMDCYGSGFVEYSLFHDANRAGILDYSGDVRVFSFGTAEIEHAKTLAAERYITMPIATADQGLLGQPGIEKPELRGRPLDGVYRLRIWDSPALQWHRLEDVQVVMKYRYWSRIVRETK